MFPAKVFNWIDELESLFVSVYYLSAIDTAVLSAKPNLWSVFTLAAWYLIERPVTRMQRFRILNPLAITSNRFNIYVTECYFPVR